MDSVSIVSMVILLLSGLILVKGQDPVYLFGKNVTLQCVSATSSTDEQFTWNDQTEGAFIYIIDEPGVTEKTFDGRNNDKYNNFYIDNNYPDDVNLLIKSLEVNDAGMYICNFRYQAAQEPLTVSVEAIPISVAISCERSFSNNCASPSSPASDSFSCNCTAFGAYPRNLQFEWSSGATVGQESQMNNTERTGTFDFYTNADIVPIENSGSVTCTLNGYEGNWREEDMKAVYNFNPPMCELKSICNETNTGVSLTCTCTDAIPAEGLVYSFFNDGELLSSGNNSVFETAIEMGQEYTFGCRGCNGVNYGSASYVTQTVTCQESTTALPTTTITNVPLSTNEPTSTKAMGTTTVEPESQSTDNPESGALGTGAIVGISLGALAVVIVIVVIAVIMCKKGKCGSKSESSSATDGNSAAKHSDIDGDELPLKVNEMKTDGKESSLATDGNSAGKHSDIDGDELPLEVNEMETDGKKSSSTGKNSDLNGYELPPEVNEMKTDERKSSSATDSSSTGKNSDLNGYELPPEVNEMKTDGKKR